MIDPSTWVDIHATATAAQGLYLGPAKISKVARDRVLLAFPDQQAWATLALAVTYQPAEGDTVLVIAQQDRWYVIGVLEGRGTTAITAPGNLELRAPHGEIRLTSAVGVRMKTKRVTVITEKLDVVAEAVTEKFQRARRQVAELYEITAENLKAAVKSTLRLKGRRVLQRADEDVAIDGEQVRLG